MSQNEVEVFLNTYSKLYKDDMEFKRWMTFINVKCHTNDIKTPQKLLRFAWEDEVKEYTPEERQKMKADLFAKIQ